MTATGHNNWFIRSNLNGMRDRPSAKLCKAVLADLTGQLIHLEHCAYDEMTGKLLAQNNRLPLELIPPSLALCTTAAAGHSRSHDSDSKCPSTKVSQERRAESRPSTSRHAQHPSPTMRQVPVLAGPRWTDVPARPSEAATPSRKAKLHRLSPRSHLAQGPRDTER